MAKIKRKTLPNDHGLTHKQEISSRRIERASRTPTDPLVQWKAKLRIAITLKRPFPCLPIDRYPPDRLRVIRTESHNFKGELRR